MRPALDPSVRTRVEKALVQPARWIGARMISGCLAMSLLALASGQLAGCGPIQVRAGKKPDVAVLNKSLQIGNATQQGVLAVLGKPDGRGRSMMPWQSSPRTVWTYYYEEGLIDLGGENSDDRRIFLFLFFDGDRFDGYLWFSSLPPSQ